MRALSLFTGCGGLDLAAEMAGIEVVGQCEIDPACNIVLKRWWPDVPRWEDVRDITADAVYERCGHVDLIFGGPPCQPVSVAGRREAAGDSRNMWPEFIRIVRDCRPRWVVAENPTGIISAQKIKGDPAEWPKGEFFGEIVHDITALGYSVGWGVWGACDVGAPHKRERVFIMAYRDGAGQQQPSRDIGESRGWSGDCGAGMANAAIERLPQRRPTGFQAGDTESGARLFGKSQRCSAMGDTEHDGSFAPTVRGCYAPAVRGGTQGSVGTGQPSGTGTSGALSGEVVGDTSSGAMRNDCKNERAPDRKVDAFADASSCFGELGDTEGQRWEEHDVAAVNGELGQPAGERAEGTSIRPRNGRCAQSGLGGTADGIPARLDFPGWPAGRSQAQYPYEPPRVVAPRTAYLRSPRIKMLGNAVVPEQAVILLREIKTAHDYMMQREYCNDYQHRY